MLAGRDSPANKICPERQRPAHIGTAIGVPGSTSSKISKKGTDPCGRCCLRFRSPCAAALARWQAFLRSRSFAATYFRLTTPTGHPPNSGRFASPETGMAGTLRFDCLPDHSLTAQFQAWMACLLPAPLAPPRPRQCATSLPSKDLDFPSRAVTMTRPGHHRDERVAGDVGRIGWRGLLPMTKTT